MTPGSCLVSRDVLEGASKIVVCQTMSSIKVCGCVWGCAYEGRQLVVRHVLNVSLMGNGKTNQKSNISYIIPNNKTKNRSVRIYFNVSHQVIIKLRG